MKGRVKWGEIGKNRTEGAKVKLRRKKAEELTGSKLVGMSDFSVDVNKIKNRNLENMIGVAQVPLGIAGPLKLRTDRMSKEYYVPLATTEGALVASINRGGKAIYKAGGCEVMVEETGTTRGPVFRVKDMKEGKRLINWLDKNRGRLEKIAGETDKHTKLIGWRSWLVGRSVYVRFRFKTGEAMGMNMVTVATNKMVRLVEKRLRIKCVSLSGNFCVDKKPSWLNFIDGRGKQVWAEVILPDKTLRQVLKSSATEIVEVVSKKQWLGSMMSGSMGFNGHYANVVAAIFLATGQDMAHVVEGSLGITTAEKIDKGLYFSVYLPSLMAGTVGGGTGLATQKESLEILGLGKGRSGEGLRLAEIIGAAALAGELSLTAALASGDLVKAHERLGRGKR